MIEEDFLSNENSTVLYKVIKKHINDQSGEDINVYKSLNIPNRIRGVMIKIFETTDIETLSGNTERDVITLNKRVIRACVTGFLQMIEAAKRNPRFRMNRIDSRPVDTQDIDTHDNINNQFEKLSQERNFNQANNPSNTPEFKEDIDNSKFENPTVLFEELEKKRNQETKRLNANKNTEGDEPNSPLTTPDNIHPSTISSGKVNQPISAKPFSDETDQVINKTSNKTEPGGLQEEYLDGLQQFSEQKKTYENREQAFQTRLKKLQETREANFKNNLLDTDQVQNNSSNMEIDENLIRTNDLRENSIYEQRNQMDSAINTSRNIYDVDPKQIFKTRGDTESQDVLPQISNSNLRPSNYNQPELINKPDELPPKYRDYRIPGDVAKYTNHILVINAYDRRWYGEWSKSEDGGDILSTNLNHNRYQFSIKFSPDSDENSMASIKRNFKNVVNIEIIDIILSAHDNPTYIGEPNINAVSTNKMDNQNYTNPLEDDVFIHEDIDDEGEEDNNNQVDIDNDDDDGFFTMEMNEGENEMGTGANNFSDTQDFRKNNFNNYLEDTKFNPVKISIINNEEDDSDDTDNSSLFLSDTYMEGEGGYGILAKPAENYAEYSEDQNIRDSRARSNSIRLIDSMCYYIYQSSNILKTYITGNSKDIENSEKYNKFKKYINKKIFYY